MIHRSLAGLMLALVLAAPAAATAQSTPGATTDLAALGLPELAVSVSETTIEGVPTELEAGRYLVTIDTTVAGDAGVEFARPAEGTTDAFLDALTMLHASHAHGVTEEATHDDDHDGHDDSHAATATEHHDTHDGDTNASATAVVYEAAYAGGAMARPDHPAQVIVDLQPGEWVATGGPDATQEPVVFQVTGEMPADLPEPDAGATITMGEYLIDVTDGALVAGSQVIQVENIGAQPHFVVASRTEADVTRDEVVALEQPGGEGAGALGLEPGFATTSQSHDTTMWLAVDLDPGTYVMLCHFPDLADGRSHAAHGMVNVVEIGR